MTKSAKRWWRFRFSLSKLLILATACGILFWFLLVRNQAIEDQQLLDQLAKSNGAVYFFDYQVDPSNPPETIFLKSKEPFSGALKPKAPPPGPSWIRQINGDNAFADVVELRLLLGNKQTKLPWIGRFRQLEFLWLRNCVALKDLNALEGLANVRELRVDTCNQLTSVDSLSSMPQLKRLSLGAANKLKTLKLPLPKPSLKRLYVNSTSLETIEFGVESGQLVDCEIFAPKLKAIVGAEYLHSLRKLRIYTGEPLSLKSLSPLTQLRELNIDSSRAIQNFDGCELLTNLEKITADNCIGLNNLDGLRGLTRLKHLYLDGCRSLRNIDGLREASGLEFLMIRNCQQVSDLSPLSSCRKLNDLSIIACNVTSLDAISDCLQLKNLMMSSCKKIKDISVCKRFSKLEILSVHGCGQFTQQQFDDVRAQLPKLRILGP